MTWYCPAPPQDRVYWITLADLVCGIMSIRDCNGSVARNCIVCAERKRTLKRRLIDGRYNVRRGLCRIRREEADIETPFGGLEGGYNKRNNHIVRLRRRRGWNNYWKRKQMSKKKKKLTPRELAKKQERREQMEKRRKRGRIYSCLLYTSPSPRDCS